MVFRVVVYLVGACLAVLFLGELFQGGIIEYDSPSSVLIFGLLVGLLDAFVKPVLRAITFPLTCLTFGAFILVINAALFALAAWIAPGISANLWGVLAGALTTSMIGAIMYTIVDDR